MHAPLTTHLDKIELTNFKLNKSGYVITLLLMYLMITVPILAFMFILTSGNKPTFGFVIISVILGFGAYFFYRLATWNKYGKEHFIHENDLLIYQPEAKKISYKRIELNSENLVVSVVNSGESVEYNGTKQAITWLKLIDGEITIQTNIKMPQSVALEIIKTFEKWGIQNDLLLDEMKD
jgi:uncharacterized membrane protein